MSLITNEERLQRVEQKLEEVLSAVKPKEDLEVEEVNQTDSRFNARRNIFILASLIITGGLSLAFWFFYLPLFAITFGVFFSFGLQAIVLAHDEFTLPGNTLKRMSKNAVAIAIYLFVVAYTISVGVSIGNSLITERSRSEEYKAPTANSQRQSDRIQFGDSEE